MDTQSQLPVEFDLQTTNNSALAGQDFEATSLRIRFEPGQTVTQVLIPLIDDTELENEESFEILLSNPLNVQLSPEEHKVYIIDDDASNPSIRVNSISVQEKMKEQLNLH